MTFSSLSMLWLLALVPPLVAIYFLKLKRPRLEVPSLLLWRRVLADPRVNSPFQRFRRHLLLWLQLALLLLLALAALQPALSGGGGPAGRIAVLVDVSASMGARAVSGGPTRLEVVKDELRAALEAMPPGQEWSIIAVADRAWRVCEPTEHPGVLQQAIDALAVRDVPVRLAEGVRLAQALGQGQPLAALRLHSDGNAAAEVPVELAAPFEYRLVPPGGANLGLVASSARHLPGHWELLVSVAGGGAPASGRVVVLAGESVLTEETVACSPGELRRLLIEVPDSEVIGQAVLAVELRPDGFDALACDDRAWLALPPVRPLRIAVAEGLREWRRVLEQLEGVVLVAPDAAPDLLVSDEPAHESLPAAMHLGIGHVPGDLGELLAIAEGPDAVVDWQRTHPLLRHVELAELATLEHVRWRDAEAEAAAEMRGWRVLVHGREGPLALVGEDGRRVQFVLRTDRSTLPWRVGFPVLAANIAAELRRLQGLGAVDARRTGAGPIEGLDPDGTWFLQDPEGGRQEVIVAGGRCAGVDLPRSGSWLLKEPGGGQRLLGAALLDVEETRLATREELRFAESTVAAGQVLPGGGQPLWPWLAALGLLVLVAEWAVFTARPQGALR